MRSFPLSAYRILSSEYPGALFEWNSIHEGDGIDGAIVDNVKSLQQHGYATISTCQGGYILRSRLTGWDRIGPFDFFPGNPLGQVHTQDKSYFVLKESPHLVFQIGIVYTQEPRKQKKLVSAIGKKAIEFAHVIGQALDFPVYPYLSIKKNTPPPNGSYVRAFDTSPEGPPLPWEIGKPIGVLIGINSSGYLNYGESLTDEEAQEWWNHVTDTLLSLEPLPMFSDKKRKKDDV